jgi:hypothetical protein
MKTVMCGTVIAALIGLAAGSSLGQTAGQSKQFGGIKLVDPDNPRGLETDVSVRVGSDHLTLLDPKLKKEVKSVPYSSIKSIDETYSITPPLPAGKLSGVSTGAASMPSYLGKEPRHWWTINTDSAPIVLRISSKVHKELKAAVTEHNVKVQESEQPKKK